MSILKEKKMKVLNDSSGLPLGYFDEDVKNKIILYDYRKGIRIKTEVVKELMTCWFSYVKEDKHFILPVNRILSDGKIENGEVWYEIL